MKYCSVYYVACLRISIVVSSVWCVSLWILFCLAHITLFSSFLCRVVFNTFPPFCCLDIKCWVHELLFVSHSFCSVNVLDTYSQRGQRGAFPSVALHEVYFIEFVKYFWQLSGVPLCPRRNSCLEAISVSSEVSHSRRVCTTWKEISSIPPLFLFFRRLILLLGTFLAFC